MFGDGFATDAEVGIHIVYPATIFDLTVFIENKRFWGGRGAEVLHQTMGFIYGLEIAEFVVDLVLFDFFLGETGVDIDTNDGSVWRIDFFGDPLKVGLAIVGDWAIGREKDNSQCLMSGEFHG